MKNYGMRPMRNNNLYLRANIAPNGNVPSIELGNYSGGGSFNMRLHKLESGEFFWVVIV
jgi:hypothetical protein